MATRSPGSMIDESRKELSSLYVAGCLSEAEKQEFEGLLRECPDLLQHTAELMDAAASTLVPRLGNIQSPCDKVRHSILGHLFPTDVPHDFLRAMGIRNCEAVVVADREGLIQWINPAFSRMCGYTLEELKGHKAGKMLQGALTDQTAVSRLRSAIQEGRPVSEELVNYHKNGTAYRVSLCISPIFDDQRAVRGFVAIEREIREPAGPI